MSNQNTVSTPVSRRTFLNGMAAASGAAALQAQSRPKPNVVFIMTDDHGAWALGSAGCAEMQTPNIDRLASRGITFQQAFACTPVCSPSRATFFSGKLPSHHGVQDFLTIADSAGPTSHRFLEGHTTFAEVLKANGYMCGLVGKWHLGNDTEAQAGFDYWVTAPGGSGPYKDVEFFDNGKSVKNTGYKTDFVGDSALRFLDEHHENPFCLVVPFFAPHDPFNYQPEKYREPYKDSDFSCFPDDEPGHPQRRNQHDKHRGNRDSKLGYSALITGVDANVGRIVDKLEELGVADNTVVIFTADHGYNCGHHRFWGKGNGTFPFNMYEQSIRVPLIWSHAGAIEAAATAEPMVSSYDFFPTLLDYLGIDAAPDKQRVGRSYAPFLRGERPQWPKELYFEFANVRSIRTEHLKLVERADGWGDELFDLEVDPGEKTNRIGAAQYRDQVLALRGRLHRYFENAGAPPLEDWRSTTIQKLPMDQEGYYAWVE
ncbi:MAG: sulfatase-like hydrolase/transferase [Acidobacteria bacterium]|nr:sulfatase-like hydrolase/transferase [Acidobacteriota bacterium]MDA1233470.1 sulfatase-like hydrolase/transferase [Acidobacteriota bacterium]